MPAATAVKKTTAADPVADLAKLYTAVEKKWGKGVIHKGSESVPVYKLPFLEHGLNYATEGGAPWGRFMSMYGEEATGKTRIAYELLRVAQELPESAEIALLPRIEFHTLRSQDAEVPDEQRRKHYELAGRLQTELDWIRETYPNGADAAFYNAEQQYDPVYAERIGIDTSRLTIVESTTIEEIVDIMAGSYSSIPIHVVDSTSNASSLLSQKQETGKSLVGTDARQWKVALRDSLPHFDHARNLGILIHQMSTNVRSGGAQPQSTRYLKHNSSLSLRFSRGKFLWLKDGVLVEDKITGADDNSMTGMAEADGVEVYVKVDKSRTCRPFRNAGLQWTYKKNSFVPLHELASTGLFHGLLLKSGSWYTVAGEEKAFGQGMKAVYERLRDDEELAGAIAARGMDYITDEGA
jgi:recombination protein RecA